MFASHTAIYTHSPGLTANLNQQLSFRPHTYYTWTDIACSYIQYTLILLTFAEQTKSVNYTHLIMVPMQYKVMEKTKTTVVPSYITTPT